MTAQPSPPPAPIAIVRACGAARCVVTIEKPYVGGSPMRVRIVRADGAPVRDAHVTASVDMARMVMHPETYALRADARGTYRVPVVLDMPGHWHAVVTVRHGAEATTIEAPFYVDVPPARAAAQAPGSL